MLAAIIATRVIPIPPAIFYGNQFVAATTTFECIALTKRAAFLSTNQALSYRLLLSTQGNESIIDQLNRLYYNIVNYLSSNANIIHMPSNLYLSNQIAAVIVAVTQLNTIVQTMSVALANAIDLADIQRRTSLSLQILHSLSVPITLNFA
jgi:hypothetical protein